jgi:RNA polymerase sigma-70 factor (ECF subfamily)
MTDDSTLTELHAAHRQFSSLLEDIRPALHRYCARMTGSVIDGEDLVQDTLAHAYYELSQLRALPALKTWLFRIAHSRAIDFLRRRNRHENSPLDDALELVAPVADSSDVLEQSQAVDAALAQYLQLTAAQRGCVILKDVLDYSLEEIAEMLEMSVSAVKAALHRGRVRLRADAGEAAVIAPRVEFAPELLRYVELFNARDWDGVRALLVHDVKLDVVARDRRDGLGQVGQYFTNYAALNDWFLRPTWLERRPVIAVGHGPDAPAEYLVQLTLREGRISEIRDFRHARYIMCDARFERG